MKPYTSEKIAKREFDLLLPLKRSRVVVKRATVDDVMVCLDFVNVNIPNSTEDVSLIRNIISHNADNIFIFWKNDSIVGVYAMLMLTPLGLERLLLAEFNGVDPDLKCLAKTGETPAGIYNWGVAAPGLAADGIRHVSQFLQQPRYQNINLFSRPNTETGVRINLNLGFKPIGNVSDSLYRYVRLVNREPKLQQAA